MEQSNNIIAAFDFDGTITKKDTYFEFVIHCFGIMKTYGGFLLLVLLSAHIMVYSVSRICDHFSEPFVLDTDSNSGKYW